MDIPNHELYLYIFIGTVFAISIGYDAFRSWKLNKIESDRAIETFNLTHRRNWIEEQKLAELKWSNEKKRERELQKKGVPVHGDVANYNGVSFQTVAEQLKEFEK